MIKTIGAKLLYFIGLLLILAVLVGVGNLLLRTLTTDELNSLNRHIKTFGFYMQFLRWGFYLFLFIYWDRVIHFMARIKQWDQAVIDRALGSKYQSIAILLAVELFLIQVVQEPVIRYFTS